MAKELLKLFPILKTAIIKRFIQDLWSVFLILAYPASLLSLIPALLRILKLYPLHPFLGLVAYPVSVLLAFVISMKKARGRDPIYTLDRDLDLKQRLLTLKELEASGKNTSPFHDFIFRDTRKILEKRDLKDLYPLKKGKHLILSTTIILSSLLLSAASLLVSPQKTPPSAASLLVEGGKTLAARSSTNTETALLAQRMQQLGEDFPNLTQEEAKEELTNLQEEVTRQIRELKRNSLSSLFEEKRIDEKTRDALSRMMDEELTGEQVQELILDLLSSSNAGEDRREALQKSFEKFKETGESGQSELAEEVLSELDREGSGAEEILRDTEKLLRDTAKNMGMGGNERVAEEESSEGSGDASEPSTTGGGIGRSDLDSGEGETGGPSDLPGRESAPKSEEKRDFTPSPEEGLKAQLPEGIVREEQDQGYLRVLPEESFQLKREDPPIYEYSRQKEGVIREVKIPVDLRNLVKDYFAQLGETYPE